MSFHSRNNFSDNKNKKKIFFIVFLFILVLYFLNQVLFLIGLPFWNIKMAFSDFLSSNSQILNSKKSLVEENQKLKDELIRLQQDKIVIDLVKKENEELKDILGRLNNNKKYILGNILIKPFLSAYDTLIIDIGSEDGVKIGDKVLANGNIYIGYISEVYNDSSKIVLYSSYGEKVPVLIGNNNIEKEALGMGGGNFKVEMPRESDIKEGDTIVLPSISNNIFGVVEKIEFKDTDSFQNVLFKSPVNVLELKQVEVILK